LTGSPRCVSVLRVTSVTETSIKLSDCLIRADSTRPGSIAAWYQSWTWQQAEGDVRCPASGLRSLGVVPGNRIAILSENSDRYLGSDLAAVWLAAAVVPVSTRLTRRELRACLRDRGVCVLLAGGTCADLVSGRVSGARGPRRTEHMRDSIARAGFIARGTLMAGGSRQPASGAGRATAGAFHTDDMTGTPREIVLDHSTLLANAAHVVPVLGRDGRMEFLRYAPLHHQAGIRCLVAVCTVTGLHMVMLRFDAQGVIGAVAEHHAAVLGLVPTRISTVTGVPRRPGVANADVDPVRQGAYAGRLDRAGPEGPARYPAISNIRVDRGGTDPGARRTRASCARTGWQGSLSIRMLDYNPRTGNWDGSGYGYGPGDLPSRGQRKDRLLTPAGFQGEGVARRIAARRRCLVPGPPDHHWGQRLHAILVIRDPRLPPRNGAGELDERPLLATVKSDG
jgi:hypothetical protein